MADIKKAKKKTRGEKKEMDKTLSLGFIQDLGGTKDDLRLLAEVNDGSDDEIVLSNDMDAEPVKREEIYNLIKELGLVDTGNDEGKEEKRKPKKLLVASDIEESDDDSKGAHTTAPDSGEPQDTPPQKQKKKEKNKFKATAAASDDNDMEQKKKKKEAKVTEKNEKEEHGKDLKTKEKKKKKQGEEKNEEKTKKETKKKKEKEAQIQHSEVSSTTTAATSTTGSGGLAELKKHLRSTPQRSHLILKPGNDWMDDAQVCGSAEQTTASLVQQCEQFAAKLLQDEVTLYKTQREKTKRGESQWIKTVLYSGTLSDKMAALMVLVQESSPHNMAAYDTLINMANKKGKREAMLAADTLKNLFVSETSPLPDDRKLIAFDKRPFSTLWQVCGGNRETVDKRLLSWHAEDLLRQKYAAFVKALDVMSYDTLAACKEKALTLVHNLLTAKPEQEDALLPMLVNKLGDPNHKIASKASYLILKLVEEHPNMKVIIMSEVERLVYRPNVTERAQYYALCLLNQIRLQRSDHVLASRLISLYFTFFQVYVKKREADSKMMAALLTGVNRAYPYAKVKQDSLSEQKATLHRIVHMVTFNTSVQALLLLFHVVDPSNSDSDRFFMALYRKLLDPALRSSAKQAQFLNLLYRSMKADVVDNRVLAFMKRLLQVGALLGPNFLCGALIIISEVLKERPHLLRIKQMGKMSLEGNLAWGDDDDDEEERFVDLPPPPEFQDSDSDAKNDTTERSDAAQPDTAEDTSSTADTGSHPPPAEGDEGCLGDAEPEEALQTQTRAAGSWVHRKNLSDQRGYDSYQRNPLHCHAQHECLWELQALTRHFHPSVSLFANTLMKGQSIEYPSDPLQDFTLIRFLDRFVYKNPKKKEAVEGGTETVGSSSGKRRVKAGMVPVTSTEFLQGGEEAVPEHERYLYRYFSKRAEEKKKKEDDAGSEASSVSDTEFDDFLDKHERQLDHDDLDDIDFGMDFAESMGKDKKKGKKKSKEDSSDDNMGDDDDDDDDDGDDDDLSDEEMDFGDDDELAAEFRREMEGLGEEEDGEEEDFDEEDFSGDELKQMMGSSSKKRAPVEDDDDEPDFEKPKKKRKGDLSTMFAAADDFAAMLENSADTELTSAGTADAVMVNDKAGAKQIAWEMKRDQSSDWRNKKGKNFHRGKFSKGKKQHKRKK